MNVKNLRVAVVPTETGNGIDQKSTVEEILNCPETQLFALTDYFQAQNNSDIDLLHWSFLIDIETKEDLTGANMDGVHYNQKAINIGKIKAIITKWGSTSVCERERDHSPCLNSIGSGKDNVSELVEQFYADSVETVVYQDEITLSYNNYSYEELPDEILDEILEIVEEYEADMLKTEKRCES